MPSTKHWLPRRLASKLSRRGAQKARGRRPGLESVEPRLVMTLPPGWIADAGGVADMVTEGIGAAFADINPTEGDYMLRLSAAGTTPTSAYSNSLGEVGASGTIVRGPNSFLAAGTTVSLDYFVSSPDAAPFNDFALGLISGSELFAFTHTGSTVAESGWQSASWVVPSTGNYQLVLVASDQGDHSLDTELYVDNLSGFYLPDSDGTFVPPPTVQFDLDASDLTTTEPLDDEDAATLVVTRTGDLSAPLTVRYNAFAGWPTGANADDYEALTGLVTFGAGENTAAIVISAIDDAIGERPEILQVSLQVVYDSQFNPLYQLSFPGFADVTINDDDGGVTAVSVAAGQASTLEGSGQPATFTLTRSGSDTALAAPLTVAYEVWSFGWDAATPDADYTSLGGMVTFAAGSPTATIAVNSLDDEEDEGAESVLIELMPAADGSYEFESWDPYESVTIEDNDGPPTVTLTPIDDEAAESGNDTARFSISLTSGPLDAPLTVTYTVNAFGYDEAVAGSDYQALPGSVTIPAGQTSVTVTVAAIDDSRGERDESLTVVLDESADGTYEGFGNTWIQIRDDDGGIPVVEFGVEQVEVFEAGPDATLTITRTGPTTEALTVTYGAYGGNAVEGVDYDTLAGTVTFAAGQSEATIAVAPIQDATGEFDEFIYLSLGGDGTDFEVGYAGAAAVVVLDDDGGPIIASISPHSINAREDGAAVDFTITRTGDLAEAMVVNFGLDPWDNAELGVDYTLSHSESVTIPAGAASATITLTPIDDADEEFFETVSLRLLAGDGYESDGNWSATISIIDNDGPPVVSVVASDEFASEPGLGDGSAVFTLTRTGGDLSLPLTVTYFTSWFGGAEADVDYEALSGTVTFAAGAETATVIVNALDDDLGEYDEMVGIQLEYATDNSYEVDNLLAVASTTIKDDDGGIATITWEMTSAEAVEGGDTPATITLTRTGGRIEAPLTVNYYTGLYTSGTARGGSDYETLTYSVTFAAGATTAIVDIVPLDDALGEEDETVVLSFPDSEENAVLTIRDDDGGLANVSLVVTDPRAMEAEADRGTFTVTRSGGNLDAPLDVEFYYSFGSAVDGVDFVSLTETLQHVLTIPAGQASATIDIVPLLDGVSEPDESVSIFLGTSSAGDYAINFDGGSIGRVIIAGDGSLPVVGPITGSDGGVRGQPLSFATTITDPDAGDTHTIAWDFGDGVTLPARPITEPGALTVAHAFPAVGTFTVTATVTDSGGATASSTRTVTISSFGLFADAADPSLTNLVVGGTSFSDDIDFDDAGAGQISVTLNGESLGTFDRPTGRIIAYGLEGNDHIQVNNAIRTAIAAELHGGSGRDILIGGRGADLLLGEDGADRLIGNGGNDVLIGGRGADRLAGGANDDLLIAGTVRLDDLDAQLRSVLAQWSLGLSYEQRVADLSSSLLIAQGESRTLFDDGTRDILLGNYGRDWFLLNRDGDGVPDRRDTLVDPGEDLDTDINL